MKPLKMDYQSLFSMKGRTGIITGAAGILGGTFIPALLQSGANIVALDINAEENERVTREFEVDYPDRIIAMTCDVTNEESIKSCLGRAIEKFGDISFLMNNHMTGATNLADFFAPLEDYKLEEWKRVTDINLDGMFLIAKHVGKHMINRKIRGSILQTASIYGVISSDKRIYEGSTFQGQPLNNPPVYSASKAGVIGLTKWMATNWAEHGIRVNAIAPGGVFSAENDVFVKKYSARVPMGRMAERHEMAGAAIFLLSDASSYVTGQCLLIDGGLSAW